MSDQEIKLTFEQMQAIEEEACKRFDELPEDRKAELRRLFDKHNQRLQELEDMRPRKPL